jgi:transcriptional regulator with XRE-family HTH domain
MHSPTPRYSYSMGYPRGDFADRLRYYRERAHLTQAALAEKLGVHEMTVVKWEGRMRNLPSSENLRGLAQALKVSMAMLLGQPYPETDAAIEDYLASPYAKQLADEGKPAGSVRGEIDFLRYQIESTYVEGRPNPRSLHQFLLGYRAAPELQKLFAAPSELTEGLSP